jgi:CDP-diacylglycerol---serine O-phosphatidyltransferase
LSIKKIIPSLLTVGNLILGIIALVLTQSYPENAALLVVVGMVLDGLDGRAARYLKAESNFGKELDSLSDIVTFGVAPAYIMYNVILQPLGWAGIAIAALFPVCGALRLARFNVQQKSSKYFVGLPITAAGGVLATMALYKDLLEPANVFLPIGMIVLSLLMVSTTRYPNFKKVSFPRSAIVMVPLLAVIVYLLFRYEHSAMSRLIFIPLALYALYGVGQFAKRRNRRHGGDQDTEVFKSSLK